jgi:hypothetical protein
MAKELENLYWIEDLLPQDIQRRRMFGGFAYYAAEKLMLLMFESLGNTSYHGEKYDFEIWNGCMFPVEKDLQPQVLKSYPYLISHPVLPKWLYLPAEAEDFEGLVQPLLREIRRKSELFGTIPNSKKTSKKKLKADVEDEEILDTSRPTMFSDEPAQATFLKAKKISDLMNLGPETEKGFLKAGIKTPQQFQKLGWKKTMEMLCKSNPKNNHSIYAYAVIGALENKIWNGISEEKKLEARQFMKSLRDLGSEPSKKPASQKSAQSKKKISSSAQKQKPKSKANSKNKSLAKAKAKTQAKFPAKTKTLTQTKARTKAQALTKTQANAKTISTK